MRAKRIYSRDPDPETHAEKMRRQNLANKKWKAKNPEWVAWYNEERKAGGKYHYSLKQVKEKMRNERTK